MVTACFLSFHLGEELLPTGHVLIADCLALVLSQVSLQQGEGKIIEQQVLTQHEFALLLEILQQHPYYAPFENLLQVYTGKNLEQCRQDLDVAQEEGSNEQVMRPVRNVLTRVRIKTRPFGIDIRPITMTGYMLIPTSQGTTRQ